MKILFIGAGNMGKAIIKGLLHSNAATNSDIFFYEVRQDLISSLKTELKINYTDINETIKQFDIIFFAVKPQVFHSFSKDEKMQLLSKTITNNQLVVSIMAGISLATLFEYFINSPKIIRCMPNTPLLIGEGMTVLSPSNKVTEEETNIIKNFFSSVGKVEVMDEIYLDAVTGLSGSGPAFVFTFIEAMIQGGILSGLSYSMAKKLAVQTVIGSAKMIDTHTLVEELRHKVTSPAGTTIQGIAELERKTFRSAVIDAVFAATNRSKELSKK